MYYLMVHDYSEVRAPVCAQSLKLCLSLYDPMDWGLSGSSVHGILQARTLEWATISFSRGLPDSGTEPTSSALAGGFFGQCTTWEAPGVWG